MLNSIDDVDVLELANGLQPRQDALLEDLGSFNPAVFLFCHVNYLLFLFPLLVDRCDHIHINALSFADALVEVTDEARDRVSLVDCGGFFRALLSQIKKAVPEKQLFDLGQVSILKQ